MLVTWTDTPATGDLSDAAAAVARGELIVIPTDTVYGLGADPANAQATARVFEVKRRARELPLPVLVADCETAQSLAAHWPEAAERLARAFWPGPLTIVVAATPAAGLRLGGSGRTVGLRQPGHSTALALLAATGPLAVTSANRSGEPPAATAADAVRQLGAAAAVYLDAGRAPGGVPSTVVDLSGPEPRVLRDGGIGQAELAGAIGRRAGRLA
jgi:tRNA threonylcarbamoyl adenosine modification protein (Sua5/YciO/YrdC/YwlC family)